MGCMKKSVRFLGALLGLGAWSAEAVEFDPAKDVDVKVVYEGQMPKITVDGRRYEPWLAIAGAGITEDGVAPTIDDGFRKLYDRGFRFFQFDAHQNKWYVDEGKYDFTRLGRRIERILSYAPEAYIIVLLRFTHDDWCRKHPDDAIVYTRKPAVPGDRSEHSGCPLRPSSASAAFRAEAERSIAAFGEYVRSQPWAKRIAGIRPSWGTYTEWHTFGIMNGPDASPVMTKRFREYLAEQGRPDPTAEVPDGECRIREGRTLLDPVKDARLIDFFRCNAESVADLLIAMCKASKAALPGRLAGAYYGYVMTGHEPEGANVLLDKVLSSPYVDYLSDPSEYYTWNRVGGGCFLHRTLTSPFHRYRKMSFLEDDSRFYPLMQYPDAVATGYVIPTLEESRAAIKRNFLNGLFDGSAYQYNDPSSGYDPPRKYWMDDPEVLKALEAAQAVYLKAGIVPAASGNDTVMVMSPRENLRTDGRPAQCPFLRKLYRCLDRFHSTGAGVDVMAFEDYLVAKKDWKRVVFLNLFSATPGEEKALAARLRRVEKIAYFAAPEKSFCDRFFAGKGAKRVTEIPDTPEDARALLAALGTRFYTDAGTCFRHHAGLSMLHTGKGGTWHLSLSDDPKAEAEELFTGRRYPAKDFTVSSDVSETWLFKVRK